MHKREREEHQSSPVSKWLQAAFQVASFRCSRSGCSWPRNSNSLPTTRGTLQAWIILSVSDKSLLFHSWCLCSVVSLCESIDHSPPGSSVHEISQARILEWVAILSSRLFPTQGLNLGLLHCRQILYPLSHLGSHIKYSPRFLHLPPYLWQREALWVTVSRTSFIYLFFICSGFCHTLKWNSHGFTCVPHPDPPSHLRLYPLPLGFPSTPGPSACLMHPTWAGDLFHPR